MTIPIRRRSDQGPPPWSAANHIAATAEEQIARALGRPSPERRRQSRRRRLVRLIDSRVRHILTGELPEALAYILSRTEVPLNGQAPGR